MRQDNHDDRDMVRKASKGGAMPELYRLTNRICKERKVDLVLRTKVSSINLWVQLIPINRYHLPMNKKHTPE